MAGYNTDDTTESSGWEDEPPRPSPVRGKTPRGAALAAAGASSPATAGASPSSRSRRSKAGAGGNGRRGSRARKGSGVVALGDLTAMAGRVQAARRRSSAAAAARLESAGSFGRLVDDPEGPKPPSASIGDVLAAGAGSGRGGGDADTRGKGMKTSESFMLLAGTPTEAPSGVPVPHPEGKLKTADSFMALAGDLEAPSKVKSSTRAPLHTRLNFTKLSTTSEGGAGYGADDEEVFRSDDDDDGDAGAGRGSDSDSDGDEVWVDPSRRMPPAPPGDAPPGGVPRGRRRSSAARRGVSSLAAARRFQAGNAAGLKELQEAKADARITRNDKASGEVVFDGHMRVDGKFQGHLKSTDGRGTVYVGREGVVLGDISKVADVVVEGLVEGAVTAKRVLLLGRSKITGTIAAADGFFDDRISLNDALKVLRNHVQERPDPEKRFRHRKHNKTLEADLAAETDDFSDDPLEFGATVKVVSLAEAPGADTAKGHIAYGATVLDVRERKFTVYEWEDAEWKPWRLRNLMLDTLPRELVVDTKTVSAPTQILLKKRANCPVPKRRRHKIEFQDTKAVLDRVSAWGYFGASNALEGGAAARRSSRADAKRRSVISRDSPLFSLAIQGNGAGMPSVAGMFSFLDSLGVCNDVCVKATIARGEISTDEPTEPEWHDNATTEDHAPVRRIRYRPGQRNSSAAAGVRRRRASSVAYPVTPSAVAAANAFTAAGEGKAGDEGDASSTKTPPSIATYDTQSVPGAPEPPLVILSLAEAPTRASEGNYAFGATVLDANTGNLVVYEWEDTQARPWKLTQLLKNVKPREMVLDETTISRGVRVHLKTKEHCDVPAHHRRYEKFPGAREVLTKVSANSWLGAAPVSPRPGDAPPRGRRKSQISKNSPLFTLTVRGNGAGMGSLGATIELLETLDIADSVCKAAEVVVGTVPEEEPPPSAAASEAGSASGAEAGESEGTAKADAERKTRARRSSTINAYFERRKSAAAPAPGTAAKGSGGGSPRSPRSARASGSPRSPAGRRRSGAVGLAGLLNRTGDSLDSGKRDDGGSDSDAGDDPDDFNPDVKVTKERAHGGLPSPARTVRHGRRASAARHLSSEWDEADVDGMGGAWFAQKQNIHVGKETAELVQNGLKLLKMGLPTVSVEYELTAPPVMRVDRDLKLLKVKKPPKHGRRASSAL